MTEKRPIGRPRTTLKDIPENWEEIVIDAAQSGASDVELRCLLGVSKDAWNTLKEDYPEFSSTVKRAHDLCQVWWERCGRKMACGEAQGNATTWIFNMKNRFGWNDKSQVNHYANDGSLSRLMDELTSVQPKSLSDFYDDEEVTGITRTIVDELEEARQLAKLNATAGAMVTATMSKAKIFGLDKGVHGDDEEEVTAVQITVVRASKD